MLEVMWSCHGCGHKKVKLDVRFRHPDEDIVSFVEDVTAACGRNHGRISPECSEGKIDLYIPQPNGGEGIGMEPRSS